MIVDDRIHQRMALFNSKRAAGATTDAAIREGEIGVATDELLRYTVSQAERVADLADLIAGQLHVGDEDRRALRVAARARDAGLLVMHRDYLARGSELTAEERTDLARHTIIGEGEAARLGFDRAAQLLIRWHHENWDGGGYPDTLAAERIPLPARILRVADTACALLAARPWRAAHTLEHTLAQLRAGAGLDFDPLVVHVFCELAANDSIVNLTSSQANVRLDQDANSNASPAAAPSPSLPMDASPDSASDEPAVVAPIEHA